MRKRLQNMKIFSSNCNWQTMFADQTIPSLTVSVVCRLPFAYFIRICSLCVIVWILCIPVWPKLISTLLCFCYHNHRLHATISSHFHIHFHFEIQPICSTLNLEHLLKTKHKQYQQKPTYFSMNFIHNTKYSLIHFPCQIHLLYPSQSLSIIIHKYRINK